MRLFPRDVSRGENSNRSNYKEKKRNEKRMTVIALVLAVFMLAGCGELWCTGHHGFCVDCGAWHYDSNGCES